MAATQGSVRRQSQTATSKPSIRRSSDTPSSTSASRRSKVRTGCRTCKVRRLKCDEARPACLRCTSTGRLCDGYGPLAIASLPFDIPGTEEERRGYHYFRLQTATVILGSQDASYWTSALLQLSYAQPAIRHALIAIASIHEALDATGWYLNANDNERGRALRMFSWRQYNESIQSILRETSANRMPIEVLIVLCLLFNQYDNLQCDYAAAFMHIKSGLRLLEQWSQNPVALSVAANEATKSATDLVKDHVAPMLVRLNVQASFLRHSGSHARSYHNTTQTVPPTVPSEFETFSQARQVFDYTASYMFHVLGRRPEDCDQAGKEIVKERLEQWWTAFGGLIGRTPVRLGSDDDRAARLLRIYFDFARIVLDVHHDRDEMGFDKQTERFENMVQQAQELVELPQQPGEQPGQPFSFDISLASPLNFVGARCRVPHIRRRAIYILKNAIKSSWNCEHCALVAQHLMDEEQRGLENVTHCSQIPYKNRVRRIYSDIRFEDGHIKLTYVRYPYTADMAVNAAIIPLRKGLPPRSMINGATEPHSLDLEFASFPSSEGETSETQTTDEKADDD